MDYRNLRRFERYTRVQTFGRDHLKDFAPGSKAATLFHDLDVIVGKLTDARVGQLRGPVGKAAILGELSLDFKDIARTARSIVLDEPGFPVAAYRHPGEYTEDPITTHAAPSSSSWKTTPNPSPMAATPRPNSPPKPPCAPNSSPTKCPPTSSPTSAPTATP